MMQFMVPMTRFAKEFAANFRRSNMANVVDVTDWKLNVTRLEDAWFVYRLITTFAHLGILESDFFHMYSWKLEGYSASMSVCYVERGNLTTSCPAPLGTKGYISY